MSSKTLAAKGRTAQRRIGSAALALCAALLAACEVVGPALTQLGLAFGQDLLAAASVNYTPRYAVQVEQLLVAMAREMSGLQFQSQLAAAGYVPPPPAYAQNQSGYGQGQTYPPQTYPAQAYPPQTYPPQTYPSQTYPPLTYPPQTYPPQAQAYPAQTYPAEAYPPQTYPSQPTPQQAYPQQAYPQQTYPPQTYPPQTYPSPAPNGPPEPRYPADPAYPASAPQVTYGDPNAPPTYGSPDPYAGQQNVPVDPNVAATSYGQPTYGQPATYGQSDPYAQGTSTPPAQYGQAPAPNPYGYATRNIERIEASIDLMVARADAPAGAPLEVIADGAVLRDGRGNPAAGDRLKVRFTVNCACYVYVVGMDATGYVARVFPDPAAGTANPVDPGREYVLPAQGEWWGLDDQRGIEQIHFLAAYVERPDIEQALDALAREPRRPPSEYRGVAEVVELPPTRGLVKVKDAPPATTVATGDRREFAPTSFLGRADDIGMVATRWFHHE